MNANRLWLSIITVGALSSSSDGVMGGRCEVGSLVIARWKNNSWYLATVTDCKNGRLCVQFEDGDKSTVSLSHVFPRVSVAFTTRVSSGPPPERYPPPLE